ncbi:MAG: antibiotic biosynthesis monooxygenase [Anaerolineales bacterium]|nr:antibiotic biosynthesis monooxygenase [Anaerolineales bacterium]
MLVVLVYVQVLPDYVEDFIAATLENARCSLQEQGIVRFDVVQQQDDPCAFVLVEVYRTVDAPGRHKETEHYLRWRDTVADMMAEPRSSIKFIPLFPQTAGWETHHAV